MKLDLWRLTFRCDVAKQDRVVTVAWPRDPAGIDTEAIACFGQERLAHEASMPAPQFRFIAMAAAGEAWLKEAPP